MKLQETIKELKIICKNEELDISADILFENAVKLVISHNIDKSKKENIANYQNTKIINPKPFVSENKVFEPATEKQVNFLKKIKKYHENMSKQEAFKIIQGLGKKEY